MKKGFMLALMFLLGFGTLIAFAWIVDIGRHQSVVLPLQKTDAQPMAAARHGLRLAAKTASLALTAGDRTTAAQALDAAKRASAVARFASNSNPILESAHKRIDKAREALQNDEAGRALTLLGQAEDALASAGEVDAITPDTPSPSRMGGYHGAVVIDSRGERVGELVSIRDGDARLSLGGSPDVFGFIDLGGNERTLPVHELLFGEHRPVGATMVMMWR